MKKLLFLLFIVAFSSCYTPRTGYIDYRERRMYDWDPIYYVPGYVDRFFYNPLYRTPPGIMYRAIPVPPQRPRTENLKPYTPPPTPPAPGRGSAPIREFPKKEDKKEQ